MNLPKMQMCGRGVLLYFLFVVWIFFVNFVVEMSMVDA